MIVRFALYAIAVFFVMVAYSGQFETTGGATLQLATRKTLKVLLYTGIGVVLMMVLQMLVIG